MEENINKSVTALHEGLTSFLDIWDNTTAWNFPKFVFCTINTKPHTCERMTSTMAFLYTWHLSYEQGSDTSYNSATRKITLQVEYSLIRWYKNYDFSRRCRTTQNPKRLDHSRGLFKRNTISDDSAPGKKKPVSNEWATLATIDHKAWQSSTRTVAPARLWWSKATQITALGSSSGNREAAMLL